jgi:hypothetical protein
MQAAHPHTQVARRLRAALRELGAALSLVNIHRLPGSAPLVTVINRVEVLAEKHEGAAP